MFRHTAPRISRRRPPADLLPHRRASPATSAPTPAAGFQETGAIEAMRSKLRASRTLVLRPPAPDRLRARGSANRAWVGRRLREDPKAPGTQIPRSKPRTTRLYWDNLRDAWRGSRAGRRRWLRGALRGENWVPDWPDRSRILRAMRENNLDDSAEAA